ncbi:MAG: hypothetical protein IPG64_22020 [Haliea sp.]|nr:hypothetical protein [Haliea sp.]
MSIIEGTYNSLVENSRYLRILFSGSLNAGMSGGPALPPRAKSWASISPRGEEQMSFLVPVEHLRTYLPETQQGVEGLTDPPSAFTDTLLDDIRQRIHQSLISQPPRKKALERWQFCLGGPNRCAAAQGHRRC